MRLDFKVHYIVPVSPTSKPLSVTNNSVGSRTAAAAGYMGTAIVAHMARSGRLPTDVVIRN